FPTRRSSDLDPLRVLVPAALQDDDGIVEGLVGGGLHGAAPDRVAVSVEVGPLDRLVDGVLDRGPEDVAADPLEADARAGFVAGIAGRRPDDRAGDHVLALRPRLDVPGHR